MGIKIYWLPADTLWNSSIPQPSPHCKTCVHEANRCKISYCEASSGGVASVAVSGRLTHQSSTGSLLGNMRSSRDRDIMNLVPSAAECSYAACFCEENVWKLCDHVRTNSPNELSKAYVVFVSNKKQVRYIIFFISNFIPYPRRIIVSENDCFYAVWSLCSKVRQSSLGLCEIVWICSPIYWAKTVCIGVVRGVQVCSSIF